MTPGRIAISKAGKLRDRPCLQCKTRPTQPLSSYWRRERGRLSIHRVKELGVAFRFLELVDQEFQTVDGAHRRQDAAQYPHLRKDAAIHQQFLLASTGFGDVNGREGALVGDLAVENDFRIAGALELFEDH